MTERQVQELLALPFEERHAAYERLMLDWEESHPSASFEDFAAEASWLEYVLNL